MPDWQFRLRAVEQCWEIISTKTIRLQQNDKKRTPRQLAVQAFYLSLFHRTVAALQALRGKLRRLDTFASSLVPRFRRFRNLNDSAKYLTHLNAVRLIFGAGFAVCCSSWLRLRQIGISNNGRTNLTRTCHVYSQTTNGVQNGQKRKRTSTSFLR